MTYMNRSGLAIRALVDYLKVSPAEILVAHDELDLPVGDARFKFGGGAGGHNGLRDTITHLGAGLLAPAASASAIPATSRKSSITSCGARRRTRKSSMLDSVGEALDALPVFLEQGAERAMNGLHGKG